MSTYIVNQILSLLQWGGLVNSFIRSWKGGSLFYPHAHLPYCSPKNQFPIIMMSSGKRPYFMETTSKPFDMDHLVVGVCMCLNPASIMASYVSPWPFCQYSSVCMQFILKTSTCRSTNIIFTIILVVVYPRTCFGFSNSNRQCNYQVRNNLSLTVFPQPVPDLITALAS